MTLFQSSIHSLLIPHSPLWSDIQPLTPQIILAHSSMLGDIHSLYIETMIEKYEANPSSVPDILIMLFLLTPLLECWGCREKCCHYSWCWWYNWEKTDQNPNCGLSQLWLVQSWLWIKFQWVALWVKHPSFLHTNSDKRMHLFERLCLADYFETFLANKFNTSKWFGLDGGEVIIPTLKDGIDRTSELRAHIFIIEMPHWGRLNVNACGVLLLLG